MKDHDSNEGAAQQGLVLRQPSALELAAPQDWGAGLGGDGRGGARRFSLGQFWSYRWSILAVFLLVAVPALAFIWTQIPPRYEAKAVIEVSPIIPRVVFKTEESGIIPLYQQYLNSQVAVIRSLTILQRVLEQPSVRETSWYKSPRATLMEGQPPPPIERLVAALQVRPRDKTKFIDVSMEADDPREAEVILAQVLDQYITYSRDSSNEDEKRIDEELRGRESTLRDRIGGIESTCAALRKQLGMTNPDEALAQQRLRMDELKSKADALLRAINLAEFQEQRLLAAPEPQSAPASGADPKVQRYEEDANWQQHYVKYKTLQNRVEIESERLGDLHPTMRQLRSDLALEEQLMRERESQLDEAAARQVATGPVGAAISGAATDVDLMTLRQRIELLKKEHEGVASDYNRGQRDLERDFDTRNKLAEQERELGRQRETYNAVRMRLDQKEMERNVPGSINIMSPAFAASNPDRDRRALLSAGALFAALAAAAGLAYVRVISNTAVQEMSELSPALRSPFLGQIPLLRNGQAASSEQFASLRESIRMIRTAVLERIGGQRGAILMTTSAGPGAGKTTIAVMLARSLAQCGKKVLLVDADLRNPSIAKHFDAQPAPGLIEVLRAGVKESTVIVETDTPGLSMLVAGRVSDERDPELLANGVLSSAFDRWRSQYDLILLDASPVLPVADARILARQADGAILVVREGHCQRTEVYDALATLSLAGGKLIGTVFVGAQRNRRYGYYGAYNAGYGASGDSMDARDA